MANSTILTVCCSTIALLLAFALGPICAAGEELPWGVERIHAHCVWDNNNDTVVDEGANAGQNVCIAVIDSGIDYYKIGDQKVYHPDLASNVAGGKGFRHWMCHVEELDDHEDYDSGDGHGTHVAGIIAAVDNTIGVIGVAPKAGIYALKLFTGNPWEVAKAINYTVDTLGAKIISISLYSPNNYTEVYTACKYAYDSGALLIACAGNNNGPVMYPANYSFVVAVGAVYPNGSRWEQSNFGPELEFVAPGVDINSTCLNETYTLKSGTSQACPHVAGVAALIWSSKPDPAYTGSTGGKPNPWNNTSVRAKLKEYALDLGPTGRDNEYGYGLINAWATNQRPLGDVNNDLEVDLKDVLITGNAFGSFPGHPAWDPRADINISNLVDLKDYYIVVQNYGKRDP